MTGIDSQLVGALAAGADGIWSTAAVLVPERVVELYELTTSGDLSSARRLQQDLQPLNRFLEYDPGYVAPAKEGLRLMGYEVGDARKPLPRLSTLELERLRTALDALGAIQVAANPTLRGHA